MIVDPLHKVSDHFRIEKSKGKLHDLQQEVGDHGDVNPRRDVQEDPSPYELYRSQSQEQRQLSEQNKDNEMQVAVPDPGVDNGLGKKGKDKLDQTADQHPESKPEHLLSVGCEVGEDEPEGRSFSLFFHLSGQFRGWFHDKTDPGFLAFSIRDPGSHEIIFIEFNLSMGRIGNMKYQVVTPFYDPVDHDKVALIPECDAGQRRFIYQLIHGDLYAKGPEPQ